jgi:hypothetical protein
LGQQDLTVLKVDLDIDSDNNGTIEDADEALEFTDPGKLIYLNQDDDNKNDTPDMTENAASITDEDDLQPINLAFSPTITGGKIILSAPCGGTRIQVWTKQTKGAASDKVALPASWTLGPGVTVPTILYVEGIAVEELSPIWKQPTPVQLKLEYEVNGSVVAVNTVKVDVVKVDLIGTDNGDKTDNLIPTSAANPPQKYNWYCSTKGKVWNVGPTVKPYAYTSCLHFESSDQSKVEMYGFDGVNPKQTGTYDITARLGTSSGAKAGRLNVVVYELAKIDRDFYNISAPGLVPSCGVDGSNIGSEGANGNLKHWACKLTVQDRGAKNVNYDLNGNGFLDIDWTPTGGCSGPEWLAVKAAVAGGVSPMIHVKAHIRLHQDDGTTNSVTDAIGLYIDAFGADPDYIVICCTATGYEQCTVAAHEVLHERSLNHVGPAGKNTQNIMNCVNASGEFLGYFKVEEVQYFPKYGQSYSPTKNYIIQWDDILR